MSDFNLVTPIVFIIFNRPNVTEKVFNEIAKAKPAKLLVIADGARASHHGEDDLVSKARSIIERVDWKCEVLKNYSDVNLGCKRRVSSGLDWVFDQVSEAIILEDDCLPTQSFFQYCQELLIHYRDDERIGMISGDNFQFGHSVNNDSYYFSRNNHIWGWATWRNRWQHDYDVDMKMWPMVKNKKLFKGMFGTSAEDYYFSEIFDRVYAGKVDTWDYQWLFASRLNGRVSIMPNINLISNIGFGPAATHTNYESIFSKITTQEMNFPMTHPCIFSPCTELDSRFFNKFLKKRQLEAIKKRLKFF